VTYNEFVEGCLRIAGPAKGKDLLRVQYTLDKKFEKVRQELVRQEESILERLERNSRQVGAKLDMLLSVVLSESKDSVINKAVHDSLLASLRGPVGKGIENIVADKGGRPISDEVVKTWLASISVLPRCGPDKILSSLLADKSDDADLADAIERIARMVGRRTPLDGPGGAAASSSSSMSSLGGDEDEVRQADMRAMEERKSISFTEELHRLLIARPDALPELLRGRGSAGVSLSSGSISSSSDEDDGGGNIRIAVDDESDSTEQKGHVVLKVVIGSWRSRVLIPAYLYYHISHEQGYLLIPSAHQLCFCPMLRRPSAVVLRARARMFAGCIETLPRGFVPRPGMRLPENLPRIQGRPVLPGVHLPVPSGEAVGDGGHAVCMAAGGGVGTLVEIGDGQMMIPKVRVEAGEDGIFAVRKDTVDDRAALREAREELVRECEKLAACDSKLAVKWSQALARCDARDLHWMPDAVATLLEASEEDKFELLEERSLVGRAKRVSGLVGERIEESGRAQKGRDDIDQLIDLSRKIPREETCEKVRRAFDKEVRRLGQLDPGSQEYAVGRQYVDLLLSLPWTSTKSVVDLPSVRASLRATHYGLEEVKERVVEICAMEKISPNFSRQVRPLLLVGPPGCGKTTIARSIAQALGRSFEMVSLGGLSDAGELKGHRRTYIGSQPGKIVSALISSGSRNPVILLDEIDKLGGGASAVGGAGMGDPASALLDALDAANGFTDNFIGSEIPIDLKGVVFVATANIFENIPPALANRFDVVRIAGFVRQEQVRIGREYVIPECERGSGIPKDTLVVEDCALGRIVESYCREMGVRELQTNLWRILRRAVVRVCEGEKDLPMQVTAGNLETWLGLPTYPGSRGRRSDANFAGASVIGLGWTEAGGTVLEVECLSSADWLITGRVGTTLQETVRIAASWSKIASPMHVCIGPDISARKDGPSLGVALAALFLAHRRGWALPSRIGFTGAITLKGRVERVGGIREKVVAASLEGLDTVALPSGNKRDWEGSPPRGFRRS
ncbi:hypothetical protein FOZ62_022947, partial [Perkinsus olseni]